MAELKSPYIGNPLKGTQDEFRGKYYKCSDNVCVCMTQIDCGGGKADTECADSVCFGGPSSFMPQ